MKQIVIISIRINSFFFRLVTTTYESNDKGYCFAADVDEVKSKKVFLLNGQASEEHKAKEKKYARNPFCTIFLFLGSVIFKGHQSVSIFCAFQIVHSVIAKNSCLITYFKEYRVIKILFKLMHK